MAAKNIEEYQWHIEWRDPKELKPYDKNAKQHDKKQVKNIANSIKRFGWQQPAVVTRDGTLIVGHGRRLAAIQLGVKMPVKVIEDSMSDEDIREYRIADNLTNENPWDFELKALDSLDLTFEGFDFEDVMKDVAEKEEQEKTVKEMQLKSFEHYDYVVFVFRNQMDWLNVVHQFGLERVDAGYGNTKKIGIGRVIEGTELLAKLGNQDRDDQPEPLELDDNNTTAAGMDRDCRTGKSGGTVRRGRKQSAHSDS